MKAKEGGIGKKGMYFKFNAQGKSLRVTLTLLPKEQGKPVGAREQ